MAKRTKASRPAHDAPGHTPEGGGTRRFRSRGVDVAIREAGGRVDLTLDGVPIEVERVDGQYFSHLAHMFTGFGSVDALVDTMLANEGRTWTLHGHVCDERCAGHGHHSGGEGHTGGGHQHGAGHTHDPHAGSPQAEAAPAGRRRGGSKAAGTGATRRGASRRGGRR